MNRDEALELARRIKRCHHSIVPLDDWTGYLAGFDEQQAAATVDALRETDPLGFKEFGDKYRELARRAQPSNVLAMPERPAPRLTREERIAILEANGAPARFIRKENTNA